MRNKNLLRSIIVAVILAVALPVLASFIVITTTSLPDATITVSYSQTLEASGAAANPTWFIVTGSGNLPAGLNLSNAGVISGTPTVAGTFTFTVQVQDDSLQTDTKTLTLVVNPAPTITTTTLPDGNALKDYSSRISAVGGTEPYAFSKIAGNLPTGLTLSSSGVISGTPNTVGLYTFTVQVQDHNLAVASRQFAININPPLTGDLITITTSSTNTGIGKYGGQLKYLCSGPYQDLYLTLINTMPTGVDFLYEWVSGTQSAEHWVSNEFFHGLGSNIPENITWTFSNIPNGNYIVAAECQAVYPSALNNPYSFSLNPSNNNMIDPAGRYGSIQSIGSFTVVNPVNTPIGSDVVVGPLSGTTLTFSQVTQEGQTTVTTSSGGQPPPTGFKLGTPPTYYSISTTAQFTPPVEVCIGWQEGQFNNENNLKLFHLEGTSWVNITTSLDTVNNVICGLTNSFSDFAIFEKKQVVVSIDIKPGSYPNSINLGSSGTVPVAIFSTPEFDATTIDPLTITLANAPVQLKGRGTPMVSFQDINGDGLIDLVVHVNTEALSLSETDIVASLQGFTADVTEVIGTDTVRIVP